MINPTLFFSIEPDGLANDEWRRFFQKKMEYPILIGKVKAILGMALFR